MKTKNNFLKKTLLFLFIFFQAFALTAPPALASILDYSPAGLAEKMIDKVMNMFGADQSSIQEMTSQMNSMPYKSIVPTVQISFNPPNPKPGEKVTATAIASQFNNNGPSLYFTWYLSRLDKDGKREKDSDDMKEMAAKLVANGGNYDDVTSSGEWKEDWKDLQNGEEDDDGYKAIFGGESETASKDANDKNAPKRCYAHDFATGENYEITCAHQFPEINGFDLCDGKFSKAEEAKWGTNPYNPDTDGDGKNDEADLCGLGQTTLTWNYKPGDEVGVIVEGTSALSTKYYDSSYMIFWALPKNSCDITDKTTEKKNVDAKCVIEIAGLPDFIQAFNAKDDCLLTFLAGEIVPFFSSSQIPSKRILASLKNITLLETDTVADIASKIIAGLTADLSARYPSITFNSILSDLTTLLEDFEDGYTNKGEFDINRGTTKYDECLTNNLVSPTEGNAFSKMDVSLSYEPKNPLNGVGQNLDLNAFISNSTDLKRTKVAWSFEACDDIDSPNCSPLPFSEIKGIGKTVGFGLTAVSLPLNIPNITSSMKYLKVTARATINFSAKASNSGLGTIYIPLTNSADQIEIYSAKIENGQVQKLTDANGKYYKRCSEDPCLVTQGETLWLESPDNSESYSWTIDGNPFISGECPSTSAICKVVSSGSTQVGSENNYSAYITITKGINQIHKANLIAENSTTGSKVDILKSFKVIEPELKIKPQVCAGENPGRITLGTYGVNEQVDDWCTMEKTSSDYSKKTFFAIRGESINLEAYFNVANNGRELKNTFWILDGTKITPEDTATQEVLGATIDGNKISFIANPEAFTDKHTVAFSGYYSENSSAGNLSEKMLSDTIEIRVMPEELSTTAGVNKKILATILSGLPSYLLFLFKITLLTSLMLFISGVISSLSSNLKTNDN